LISHGGHAAAAGFKVRPGFVDAFRESFCKYASERLSPRPAGRALLIDAEVPLSALTPKLVEALGKLEPYGMGNPCPQLLAGPVDVVGAPRRVGKGERHLQFRVRQEQTTLKAIAFNSGDRAEELTSASGQCCVVFTPKFNDWNGYRSVELEVADFQPGPRARLG
jgi:single-stranded-DNA-specific exonuclease